MEVSEVIVSGISMHSCFLCTINPKQAFFLGIFHILLYLYTMV